MTTESKCPSCGAMLPEDAPGGLCPKCLIGKGFESEQRNGSDTAGNVSDTRRLNMSAVDLGQLDANEIPAVPEPPGRYSILGQHGKGGMGRVLLVHDEHLGRDVALKELLPDLGSEDTPSPARHSKEMAARFLREAKITGQLEHPSITPVHELGRRADGSLYYTMKLVRGRTLQGAIRDATTFEDRLKLLPHFVDLCNAVAYAHSRGVIHRDIKPANIMIGDYGETVIVDWGLAKIKGGAKAITTSPDQKTVLGVHLMGDAKDSANTQYGQTMGTPAYMSPEQATGDLDRIDERSDIYSLGAVLFELLTKVPPVDGVNIPHIIHQVITGQIRKIRDAEPKVPKELAAIVSKAMSLKIEDRYSSAKQLAQAVEEWKPRRRRSKLVVGFQVCVLSLLVLIPTLIFILNRTSERQLMETYDRLKAKNIVLSDASDFDVAALLKSDRSTPSEETSQSFAAQQDGLGALYGIYRQYPDLADYKSAFQKTLTELFTTPSREDREKLRAFLDANRTLLEKVKQICTLDSSDPESLAVLIRSAKGDPFGTELPNLLAMRSLFRLCLLDAELAYRDGRPDEALTNLRLCLRLGEQFGRVPYLITFVFRRTAVIDVVTSSLRMCRDTVLTTEQLRQFQGELKGSSPRNELRNALIQEMASGHWMYITVKSRLSLAAELLETSMPRFLVYVYGNPLTRFWTNWDHNFFLSAMEKNIALSERTYVEAASEYAEPESSNDLVRSLQSPLRGILFSDFKKPHALADNADALFGLVSIAADVRTYIDVHGATPKSLAELYPTSADTLPKDPFSGKPYVYVVNGDNILVYSIGQDLKDDGGNTDTDLVWKAEASKLIKH